MGIESAPHSEQQKESKEVFESRASYAGRLAEYITGLKLDNPKLIERLLDDQAVVRGKYNLPPKNIRFDIPGEYEKILRDIAQANEVRIDSKSECGTFFMENPGAAGVHFNGEGRVGTDINRATEEKYAQSLSVLEHELIHAMQHKDSPRMPVELMEYEAYVAGSGFAFLKGLSDEERSESLKAFFSLVGFSVSFGYREQSKREGREVKPKWDAPEYFDSKYVI